jgi:hypothetical protein
MLYKGIITAAEKKGMIEKLLTLRGWRVVSHSMLAAAGAGLLYFLSEIIIGKLHQGSPAIWWALGGAVAVSLWMVALGSMLARFELKKK